MATDVRVLIRGADVIRALNTPGGPVREYVDNIGKDTRRIATATAPVNDPLDAQHRGGVVGTYKASFRFDRRGSRGHRVIGRVTNSAGHADIVENGRSASHRWQRFSWTVWGGDIRRVDYTGAREGKHILRNALRQAYFFEVGLPQVTAQRSQAAARGRRP